MAGGMSIVTGERRRRMPRGGADSEFEFMVVLQSAVGSESATECEPKFRTRRNDVSTLYPGR